MYIRTVQVRDLGISHIAIGDGTACRQTEKIVAAMIKAGDFGEREVVYAIISEQGTSIYRWEEDGSIKISVLLSVSVISAALKKPNPSFPDWSLI